MINLELLRREMNYLADIIETYYSEYEKQYIYDCYQNLLLNFVNPSTSYFECCLSQIRRIEAMIKEVSNMMDSVGHRELVRNNIKNTLELFRIMKIEFQRR